MTSLYVVITNFENSSLPTSSGVSAAFNYSQTINGTGQLSSHGTCPLSGGLQNFIGVSMPDILTSFSGTSISDIYIQGGNPDVSEILNIGGNTYNFEESHVTSGVSNYEFDLIAPGEGGSLGNFSDSSTYKYALLNPAVNPLPYEIKFIYAED